MFHRHEGYLANHIRPTLGSVALGRLTTAMIRRWHADLRLFVLLAAFGGLRRGEPFGLTRADIDLLHQVLHVRSQRQESKRGEELVGPPARHARRLRRGSSRRR